MQPLREETWEGKSSELLAPIDFNKNAWKFNKNLKAMIVVIKTQLPK